jgi:outer membrane protein insertion porin family
LSFKRAVLFATACLVPVAAAGQALAPGMSRQGQPARPAAPTARQQAARPATPAQGQGDVIQAIRVEGNQRIEAGTILSYMLLAPGDRFDQTRMDDSLKTLYATGLFSDVMLRRDGNDLVVHVVENPLVNQVAFEGNHRFDDNELRAVVQLAPRSVFTPAAAESDRQRILDYYAHHGRFATMVTPQIIRLPQNRVNVVYKINDGSITLVSRIAFVGNHAFSQSRLKEVIQSRQEAIWHILDTSDEYDPARVDFDKELLRRFYLKNGYVDFRVTDVSAELTPDRSAFFLTFTLNEGQRYRLGTVNVDVHLKGVTASQLRPLLQVASGDWYDGDLVERSSQAIQDYLQNHGFAFVQVDPRVARDPAKHTVNLVFNVTEGPRVYVERINIVGNTRTEDKVIRREFQLAEGDAYNAAAIRRTRQRLQDLGYFNNVDISTTPGSAPDRAIVTTTVQEKATGELNLGGGYSTDAGALLSAGLRERNLVGTGIDASLNGVLAQRESQIDLSVTDPYFLDRNIVTGFDVFDIRNNNFNVASYFESRYGFTLRAGYQFNDHLSQAWTYSLVERDVYNIQSGASLYVLDQAGKSLLSQIGTTLSLDYRDSKLDPHSGFLIQLGTDFAGLGGDADFVRTKINGNYYIPLENYFGSPDWYLSVSAGAGYLSIISGQERIIDNFFLGGDNLRGFQDGGAGPHTIPTTQFPSSDSIGGRFIWTQSTELHYPLPVSPDLGLSGRAFVDVGGLSQVNPVLGQPIEDSAAPRVGVGVGISWRSPFGLINIDLADAVVKQKFDQTQVFRFGFGTNF